MIFDRDAKLNISHANNQTDLLTQMGNVGSKNGRRTGQNTRTTISNEAFLARRFILHLMKNERIVFPFSIHHDDCPDFVVTENGNEYGIEVSEACPPRDGREMAKQEELKKKILFGALGGNDNFNDDKPLDDVSEEIRLVISKKSKKAYVNQRPTDLLIYTNSNASVFVDDSASRKRVVDGITDLGSLRRVYIYWGATLFDEINEKSV